MWRNKVVWCAATLCTVNASHYYLVKIPFKGSRVSRAHSFDIIDLVFYIWCAPCAIFFHCCHGTLFFLQSTDFVV